MKSQVGQVGRSGPQTVELAIEHVGEPREWMPVARDAGREGPGDALHCQAFLNDRVLGHVFGIVVGDEVMAADRRVHDQGDREEQPREEPLRRSRLFHDVQPAPILSVRNGLRAEHEGCLIPRQR